MFVLQSLNNISKFLHFYLHNHIIFVDLVYCVACRIYQINCKYCSKDLLFCIIHKFCLITMHQLVFNLIEKKLKSCLPCGMVNVAVVSSVAIRNKSISIKIKKLLQYCCIHIILY